MHKFRELFEATTYVLASVGAVVFVGLARSLVLALDFFNSYPLSLIYSVMEYTLRLFVTMVHNSSTNVKEQQSGHMFGTTSVQG